MAKLSNSDELHYTSKKTSKKELSTAISSYRKFQLSLSPQQNLLYGFLLYTCIGCALLCLPFSQKVGVGILDNLFVATSSISTTGLSTVSIFDSYTLFGQFIIMLLVQIGGIGYMTFTSFVLLSNKSKLTHWHQRVLNAEFAMPKGLDIKDFLKSVIIFTIMIEIMGAICFYIAFRAEGIEHNFAIWSSIFHSISSFCTAGFGLYNDSFEQFSGNYSIQLIISVLSILGSLGFIVITDVWHRITRKAHQITYTTKIIVGVTFFLLAIGTIFIYFFEPSLNAVYQHRLLNAFFQAMTAMTTVGFNTVPLGTFSQSILLIIIMLMYIGASPSGTGGGLKSTTFFTLLAIIWNRIRNNKQTIFLGKLIPTDRINLAISIFLIYSTLLFISTFSLTLSDKNLTLMQALFETTSAIGTVGLSTGITSTLSEVGKVILIIVMFVGRLGVLTFGLAILARRKDQKIIENETDIAL